MLLLGSGAGIAFSPVLLAGMGDVQPTEAGLASGVVNTSFIMGGGLGLAVLATVAVARADDLEASGEPAGQALAGGYYAAFLVGAMLAAGDRGVSLVDWTSFELRRSRAGERAASAPRAAP